MKARWWKLLISCALAALALGGLALASELATLWSILPTIPAARPWEAVLWTPTPSPATPSPSETPASTPTPQPTLPLETREEGVLSLLLIGVDAHGKSSNGRSDTMILARLNANTGEIKLVSFLRDLYVKIPGRGKNRLNAAYFYGGAELLQKTLSSNFGIAVDATVAVDFKNLVAVIDQLGGVPVTLDEKERVAVNAALKTYNLDYGYPKNDRLLDGSGEQLLDGKQALCFSRLRKIDSDFVRTDRQRQVLEGMLTQARNLSFPKLLAVAAKVWDSLDTNLSLQDVTSLLPLVLGDKEMTLSGIQIPTQNGYRSDVINGMMVLVPNLDRNTQAIRKFLQ